MDSVAKPTILDFVGNWLPWECSVCGSNGSEIRFAWWTDPILCWECAESAPPGVCERLQRVKAARLALGFENVSLYDIEKALWPGVGRFDMAMDRRVPPVFGRPFMSPLLRKGQNGELYYLWGLSSRPPDQLPPNETAALYYDAWPARSQVVALYRQWQEFWTPGRDNGSGGDSRQERPPFRSEVVVYIGGAIIPEAHPEDHYMWSWRPRAPWSGYEKGPHRTDSLAKQEVDSLFKVGKQLLGKYSRRRPEGTGNFAPDEGARFMDSLTKVLEQHERDGIKITSIEMLADTWGVLGRSQLHEMFKQFPEARERYRQHKQKPRRRT